MQSTLGTESEANTPISHSEHYRDFIETLFSEVMQSLGKAYHIPAATYRVQLNRFFTFRMAGEQAEYLARLGISDLYASPYFRAHPESLHGYDIANHNELNPSIGTEQEYDGMVEALHAQGLYQVLDIVPNHMGISREYNAWWTDVLENGPSSLYAPYFDIEWDPINPKITNKVLLPLLGDQYGKVLENKELQLAFLPDEGRFVLRYYENSFPINPQSYRLILRLDHEQLIDELGPESEAAHEYQSILTALEHLPLYHDTAPERVVERSREKEVIKRRIAALCAAEPRVRRHIEQSVDTLNGVRGDPRSFDRLDALLEQQPYRLSFWRVAGEEINYRRFFDVNELAAIQVERPRVFEETHRMIMRLLGEGKVNGLRVDHVDGLRDPAGYLQALQHGYFLQLCRQQLDALDALPEGFDRAELETALLERWQQDLARAAGEHEASGKPLYVVVEKILGHGETLPGEWPVQGTTGYEFTNALNGLFVDSTNQKALDDIYSAFIGEKIGFPALAYESKKQIMRLSLSSEINVLTGMLNQISQRDRRYRDFTVNNLRNTIREVVACFPVYRTYITPDCSGVSKRDRAFIQMAVAAAKKRNPALDPSIFDFLRDILLLEGCEALSEQEREEVYDFVMKFQQVTGPVIAKGLEDTAFYRYNRLISLNEVGGEPEVFGVSPQAFHKLQADRLRAWPHSIVATSTHDTKRSEDVRARINVLSEVPREWRAAVRRWAKLNRKHKKHVEGQLAPSPNEEYFLYQTLLGVWPSTHEAGEEEYNQLVARVQAYMRKAMNEAKVTTSWINPHEAYQEAVAAFIAAILRRDNSNPFLADFAAFAGRVAHYGVFNSLSQTLIKITSPGVPDIYQGQELWDFSMVDPDNRRPVDYKLRRRLLSRVEKVNSAKSAAPLLQSKEDGRIKLLVTSRALNYRCANRALFERGAYTPLQTEGKHQENIIAYARSLEARETLIVAPRLITRLGKSGEMVTPTGEVWDGERLLLPGAEAGAAYRDVFTGEITTATEEHGAVGLPLNRVLGVLPVAMLEKIAGGREGEKESGVRPEVGSGVGEEKKG